MTNSTATDLFQSGDLDGAVEALTADVKAHPNDVQARGRLAEMLCFRGEFDRADRMMEVMALQDEQHAAGIGVFRRVLRGAIVREQVFTEGRAPEFVGPPSDALKAHVRALDALRAGDSEQLVALLEEAEAVRPPAAGQRDGTPFEDMRDLDDLTAGVLEVIAASGAYYWVDLDTVVSLTLHPPERPRDLIWRRASIEVRGGPEGEVFIPALYVSAPGTTPQTAHRLGRVTDWVEPDGGGPVLGLGQRVWLLGEQDTPIMEVGTLTFDAPRDLAPGAEA